MSSGVHYKGLLVARGPREAAVLEHVTSLGSVTRWDRHEAKDEVVHRIAFHCDRAAKEAIEVHDNFKEVSWEEKAQRVCVFASKASHVLRDIFELKSELDFDVPLVASNHDTLKPLTESYGSKFVEIKGGEGKIAKDADVVVLARYMQILSPEFCDTLKNRIINVHHSLLPAFPGARAYHRAHAKGVKVCGATAHYVTADLDAGPIIAQVAYDTSHKDTVASLTQKGRQAEALAMRRALKAHLQKRVFVLTDDTTVVFDE